jgi:hypothetical protein
VQCLIENMLDRKLTEDDTASSQAKHSLVSAHNAAHVGGGGEGNVKKIINAQQNPPSSW